jgi:hypothetical protein
MAKRIENHKPGWIGFYGVTYDGRVVSWEKQGKLWTPEEVAERQRLERNARRRAKYAADKAAKAKRAPARRAGKSRKAA